MRRVEPQPLAVTADKGRGQIRRLICARPISTIGGASSLWHGGVRSGACRHPFRRNISKEQHAGWALSTLQLATLIRNCMCGLCRYYVSWRNVALNGVPLPDEAMARLHLYAIPRSGRLTLDYVSYQVRGV